MCSCEQHFTCFVRFVSSSFIVCIEYMKCVVSFGHVLKKGSGSFMLTCSPSSLFAVKLAVSRPEDAFIGRTANSMILSIAVIIAFRIETSTVYINIVLPVCLSILSLRHLSNVQTFAVFILVAGLSSFLLTLNTWLTGLLLPQHFALRCCSTHTNVLIKLIQLAKKPSVLLFFLSSGDDFCSNESIALIKKIIKSRRKFLKHKAINRYYI